MRILLILWFLPLLLFWGWYGLSAYDISFGFHFLSRDLHELVFQIYANMIGTRPEVIPGMIAAACAVDTGIILAICAYRWRADWYPQTKARAKNLWTELSESYWHGDVRNDYPIYEERQSGRVPPGE